MKKRNIKNLLPFLLVLFLGIGIVSCKKEHADEETVKKEFFRLVRLYYDNPKENLEIIEIESPNATVKEETFISIYSPKEIKKLKKLLKENLAEDAEFVEGRAEDEQNCFYAIEKFEKYDLDKIYEYDNIMSKTLGFNDDMLNGWMYSVKYRHKDSDPMDYKILHIVETESGTFVEPDIYKDVSLNNRSLREIEIKVESQNPELTDYYYDFQNAFYEAVNLCEIYLNKYVNKYEVITEPAYN